MSLKTEIQGLYAQLQRLHDALMALRVTIIEDRPLEGARVMLLDAFGDATEDAVGWLEEALVSVAPHAQLFKGEGTFDTDGARQTLVFCQEQFNRISHRFMFDLLAYDRIAELMRLGQERRGEWRVWAASVKQSLEGCQQHLYDTNQALFRCWQELAERVGMTSVSVRATNIGQQLTVPTSQEPTLEGVP
ncbi:MAG TPA: hypothetical protein VGV59_21625 [Pyrinomonadaceae bacterium]|nr:hypothetical protein [Pyrinomonadaceae bacterium]